MTAIHVVGMKRGPGPAACDIKIVSHVAAIDTAIFKGGSGPQSAHFGFSRCRAKSYYGGTLVIISNLGQICFRAALNASLTHLFTPMTAAEPLSLTFGLSEGLMFATNSTMLRSWRRSGHIISRLNS